MTSLHVNISLVYWFTTTMTDITRVLHVPGHFTPIYPPLVTLITFYFGERSGERHIESMHAMHKQACKGLTNLRQHKPKWKEAQHHTNTEVPTSGSDRGQTSTMCTRTMQWS